MIASAWKGIGSIIASWVISPICAGIVTAIVLLITQQLVLKSENSFNRGLIALPFYFFITLAINVFYIVFKGSPGLNLSKLPLGTVFGISFGISGGVFLWCWFFLKPYLKRRLGEDEPLKWYHVFFIPLVSKREPPVEVLEAAPSVKNEKTGDKQEEECPVDGEESDDAETIAAKDGLFKKSFNKFKAKMNRGIESEEDDGM